MHSIAINHPWQQVCIDLVGLLQRSSKGHVWLLNMQNCFSKWVEMRPLRWATTPNILRDLTEAIVLRHRCLDEVLSDNGMQIKSVKLTGALREMRIRHKFTPAYAPQCNPVECANRMIKTMIS